MSPLVAVKSSMSFNTNLQPHFKKDFQLTHRSQPHKAKSILKKYMFSVQNLKTMEPWSL